MVNKIIKFIIIICFKILLYVSVFIGIIYLLYSIYNWYTHERHINKIKVIAEFDNKRCVNTEYPLAIIIKNDSLKTIKYSTIYVKVSYIGHSNELNDYEPFEDDRIIKSGNLVSGCWKVKSKKTSYSYPVFLTDKGKTVEITSTYFRFKND